jgi:hypothetical protein
MSNADGGVTGRQRPWLLDLATTQRDSGPHPGLPLYDEHRQMTYMQTPRYEPAIDSSLAGPTKKADRETGEDQKGF